MIRIKNLHALFQYCISKKYKDLCVIIFLFVFFLQEVKASVEPIPSGSFIINMGVTPQTISNGLKPYGLIFDLLENYHVPIKWVINPSKGKDGIDFTYNSVDYKGGTFIIPAEYRTAAVNARITYWTGQGVVGITTTSVINVPVAVTLNNAPNWTLDQQNGSISQEYLENAMIPSSAWSFKEPSELNCCDDVFAMPHADPEWSTHSRLYSWNDDCKGSIWAACHAVSALENLYNPLDTSQQMNFLSNKIPKLNKPSPYAENSLLVWGDHGDGSTPYNYFYHTDPFMQFLGTLDDATTNGSEQIFMPVLTGSWRNTTKLAVVDPTHADVPLKSPGPAAVVAYGRGFGDNGNGMVMYEAGHTHNKDQDPANIAAQRAMLNFSFFASIEKAPYISVQLAQDTLVAGQTYNIEAIVTSIVAASPYAFVWSSLLCGGTIGNTTASSTTFTPSCVNELTECILQVVVTDACGRVSFHNKKIIIATGKPDAGPDQNLGCFQNPTNAIATMAAIGTGNWSAQPGNPGTAVITNAASPNTTITNFSATGTYHFIYTNSIGCAKDTMSIVIAGKPNAGQNQSSNCISSYPGGSVIMNASGSGTWSSHPGNPPSVIANALSPVTAIGNFSASGTYNYIWTASNGCTDTASVLVTSKPDAGIDQQISCIFSFPGGDVTMNASGNGNWTLQNGSAGTANIVNANSATTSINNFSAEGNYYFIWTNTSGCSDTVKVSVTQGPVGSANPQTICSGETSNVILNSTIPGTTFSWTATQLSGATITGFGNCPSNCGTTISQTLTNTGTTIAGIVRYTVIPFSPNGCQGNAFTVDVTVNPFPQGSANPQTICSGAMSNVILNSTIAGSTFRWTAAQNAGAAITGFTNCSSSCGTVISQTLTNTSNVNTGVVRYTIIPISPEGCEGNAFTVDVTVNPKPDGTTTAQTICSDATSNVILNSTIAGTTFSWTAAQLSGAAITGYANCASSCGNIIWQTLTNTSNVNPGVVRYTVTPISPDGCEGNAFTVDVTVNPKPIGSAIAQTLCSGATSNVILNSTIAGTTFTWTAAQLSGAVITGFTNCSSNCGSVISQALTNTSNVNPGVVGYTITPISPEGCEGNAFTVDVTVNPKPQGFANAQTICSGSTTDLNLNSTIPGTSFSWTANNYSGAAILGYGNCNSLCGSTISQTLFNSSNIVSGTIRYSIIPVSSENCTGELFTIDEIVNPNPVVTVDATPSCTGINNGTLQAIIEGGTSPFRFSWSNGSNASSLINIAPGNYTVSVSDFNGCRNTASAVVIESGITNLTASPGICESTTNMYSLTGVIHFQNAPTTGTLTIQSGLTQQVFTAPFSNPQSYALNGMIADGSIHTVTATFSDFSQCSKSISFTAPQNCLPVIRHTKTFQSYTQTGVNTYDLNYQIIVSNTGGAGAYNLKDHPQFDDDIIINAASFTSNALGNAGGVLNIPAWSLAYMQAIPSNTTHTYQLRINASINLDPTSAGDNVYNSCSVVPIPGTATFNRSELDTNNDGIPEEIKIACGDLPYIDISKVLSNIQSVATNEYELSYELKVSNTGGAIGTYDLTDIPAFENDIEILNASFTSNIPSNPGSLLNGNGPWTLSNDQAILNGATFTYNVVIRVKIDLVGGSGDNIYNACKSDNGFSPGEGLFNRANMDTNNDGVPETSVKTCGDLPFIIQKKTMSAVMQDLGGYNCIVTYYIEVKNTGGANGNYTLIDAPVFDDDVVILSASYTSDAPGNPGNILSGSGPWQLAGLQNIVAGEIHHYTLIVKVNIDLRPGSGGDNLYHASGNILSPGEGLFNQSMIDLNNDAIPEVMSEVAGNLPYVVNDKKLVSITSLGGHAYKINYEIEVRNGGGDDGKYDLKDIPGFEDDIQINSAVYSTNVPGNPGAVLPGSGPWLLANDQNISAGDAHIYYLEVVATIQIAANTPGDERYNACGIIPASGQGLFNQSTIDTNDDEIPEHADTVCGDLPFVIEEKTMGSINPIGKNKYQVNYTIELRNHGGATGVYDLYDVPAFDDDVQINSALFTSNIPSNPGQTLIGSGPWKLANDQTIAVGVTHSYQLAVQVTLDLSDDSNGDHEYLWCGASIPDFQSEGEGLFNKSMIDINNDDIPEHTDHVCGDLPYITGNKSIQSITATAANDFTIVYRLEVRNLGGEEGTYDMTDAPAFDDDIMINSASYTSDVTNLPGSVLNGNGPWKIGNDITIGVGEVHNYEVVVHVTIDLSGGSAGNNSYHHCGFTEPEVFHAGEGVYNEMQLDIDNNGTVDEIYSVCDDLPYVTHDKTLVSTNALGGNMFEVIFKIEVRNLGAVAGQYDLTDKPLFDPHILISNASYTSNAVGNPGAALFGSGPWSIANDQAIDAFSLHSYLLKLNVIYKPGSAGPGNEVYHKCGYAEGGFPSPNEGMYNRSVLDINNDGFADEEDFVCEDLPGIAQYGSRIWHDKNANGKRDPGEEGVAGVYVVLYDAVTRLPERSMTTDTSGKYLFEKLKSKTYYAKYVLPPGWLFTNANQGPDSTDSDVDGSNGASTNATVFLDPGEEDLSNDAGLLKCASISGDVWFDIDMDGIYDFEEKGINGLNVYLIDAMTGNIITTLKTNVKPGTASSDGYYKADCIKPGMYYIKFERPGHLGAGAAYKGNNPKYDSDITHENGINTTKKFTIGSGDVVQYIGAGFQIKSQLGDKVWIDQNVNGIQDQGEKPLQGVKVSAYNSNGIKVSESESGADGKFMLDGITQGEYYMKFETPGGKYGFTIPHAGLDEMDSDVDGTNGYGSTKKYTIQPGEIRPHIDAGVVSQVLALEWLDFTANYNGSFTELDWQTGIEENNEHFIIERRFESEKNFSEIGNMPASAEPYLAKHSYAFDDFNVSAGGMYYYRIKQVDVDGSYTYSKIIAVRIHSVDKDMHVFIYPNPVSDILQLEIWLPGDTRFEVTIYDKSGKEIMHAPFSQFKTRGNYLEQLDISNLVTGQYALRITTSYGVYYKKFTVSR